MSKTGFMTGTGWSPITSNSYKKRLELPIFDRTGIFFSRTMRRGRGARKGQPCSYTEQILLILGNNVTLYFHNNSVDQKNSQKLRGTKYQFLPPTPSFLITNSVFRLPEGVIRGGNVCLYDLKKQNNNA